MCSTRTSGYSGATSSTMRRQRRDVSRTFALSTDVSWPRRVCASRNARRTMRSTWRGCVLARVERRAVLAHAARAEVEPADELAHDQHVDAVERPPAAGSRTCRARRAAASSPCSGRTSARVELGVADRALQHRDGGEARVERLVRAAASRSRGSRAAPISRSSSTTSGASSSSTRRASRATSGPMPSPGRRTTRPPLRRQTLPRRTSAAGGRAGAA